MDQDLLTIKGINTLLDLHYNKFIFSSPTEVEPILYLGETGLISNREAYPNFTTDQFAEELVKSINSYLDISNSISSGKKLFFQVVDDLILTLSDKEVIFHTEAQSIFDYWVCRKFENKWKKIYGKN